MKYLIVSADDLGLSKSINEGIVKAYKDGIVNFLNFIPTGYAFDDARLFTESVKLDEMGAHLALTETSPLSPVREIPSLVAKNNKFHENYASFFRNYFSGRINPDEIYIEFKHQIEALKELGVPITNLSSHEHIHMMPGILKIFIRLAKEYKIPSIRALSPGQFFPPLSLKKIYKMLILHFFGKKMKWMLKESGLNYTDSLLGFLTSGGIDEDMLKDMIKNLKPGTTELVCHPGFLSPEVVDRCVFHSNCETELFAFTSREVKELVKEEDVKLVKFSGLPVKKGM